MSPVVMDDRGGRRTTEAAMTRWCWKRGVWALLTGAAVAAGAAAQGPKPNDTITLKFPGLPDQKVKIIKSTRQADGKYHTEVKNPATGETYTLIDDSPPTAAPAKGADKAGS